MEQKKEKGKATEKNLEEGGQDEGEVETEEDRKGGERE